jgi:hypothetical protein
MTARGFSQPLLIPNMHEEGQCMAMPDKAESQNSIVVLLAQSFRLPSRLFGVVIADVLQYALLCTKNMEGKALS